MAEICTGAGASPAIPGQNNRRRPQSAETTLDGSHHQVSHHFSGNAGSRKDESDKGVELDTGGGAEDSVGGGSMPKISRRDVIAATAAGAIDSPGVEAAPAVEKDNMAAVTATVATVSHFTASKFPKSIGTVIILGFRKPGIGTLSVRRVATQPSHPWKFRSADVYLPNGSTDATNGGWWEGYIDGNQSVGVEQFGLVGDGVTDNLAAFNNIQSYIWNYLTSANSTYRPTIKINFGDGKYYFSGTINLYVPMILQGLGSGLLSAYSPSVIIFNDNVPGFIVNKHNTSGIAGYKASNRYSGCDGTEFIGLYITTKSGGSAQTPLLPYSIGLWIRCRVSVIDCQVVGFGNDCIKVWANSGATDYTAGEANGFYFRNVSCVLSPGSGIHITGSDVNAGMTENCQFSSMSWALRDDSFLGNTHIAPQSSNCGGNPHDATWGVTPYVVYNGFGYAIITSTTGYDAAQLLAAQTTRPTGANSANSVWYSLGADSPGSNVPTWGQVKASNGMIYNVVVGQEANMWTHEPSANPSVWGSGVAPTAGYFYIPWAQAAAMATGSAPYVDANNNPVITGPYIFGGPYRSGNASGQNLWLKPYLEGGAYPHSHHMNNAIILGGNDQPEPYSNGIYIGSSGGSGVNGYNFAGPGFESQSYNASGGALNVRLGNGASPGTILQIYDSVAFTSTARFLIDSANDLIFMPDAIRAHASFTITGPNTTTQFNTGAPYPGGFFIPSLMLGPSLSQAVNFTMGGAAPKSGAHSEGEIVVNNTPGVATPFAWRCAAAGTPGTWAAIYPSSAPDLGDVGNYSALPAANSVPPGTRAIIHDCYTASLGAIAAGGGSTRLSVNSDGASHWYVG